MTSKLADNVGTAARTGETIGATWPEIDTAGKVWTIKGERMKGEREHRVPLSAPALAILRRMAEVREGEHVFPGSRNVKLANSGMSKLLGRMGREGSDRARHEINVPDVGGRVHQFSARGDRGGAGAPLSATTPSARTSAAIYSRSGAV